MYSRNLSQIALRSMLLLALILSQTGIAQASDGLDTWVWFHLIWNIGLKTLNYFLCFPVHDLGYLDTVSPKFPYCPKYQKIGRTRSWDGVANRVKLRLIWIIELEIFNYFSGVPAQYMGYLDQVWPNFPNVPIIIKQVIITPSDSFVPGVRPYLLWKAVLIVLDSLTSVLSRDFGYFDPVSLNCTNVPNNLKQLQLNFRCIAFTRE